MVEETREKKIGRPRKTFKATEVEVWERTNEFTVFLTMRAGAIHKELRYRVVFITPEDKNPEVYWWREAYITIRNSKFSSGIPHKIKGGWDKVRSSWARVLIPITKEARGHLEIYLKTRGLK